MNTKTTLTFVLIAAALGIFVLQAPDSDKPGIGGSDDKQATPGEKPLFKGTNQKIKGGEAIGRHEPTKIVIEKGDQEVVIEKEGNDWVQVKPIRFALQEWSVRNIPTNLSELKTYNTIDASDSELKSMGLKSPAAVVTVSGEINYDVTFEDSALSDEEKDKRRKAFLDKKGLKKTYEHKVILGKIGALGKAYAQLKSGSTAYAVNNDLHKEVLNKDLKKLRKTSLTTVEKSKVDTVEITAGGNLAVKAVQNDDGWALTGTAEGRADKTKVEDVIKAIDHANIDEFVEDNPKDLASYGLDNPSYVLLVTEKVAKKAEATDEQKNDDSKEEAATPVTHRLVIGSPFDPKAEKYCAMWNDVPVVFTLSKTSIEKLKKSPNDLRDPKLSPANKSDVKTVKIQRGDVVVDLKKDGGDWKYADDAIGYGVDGDAVKELLDKLFDAKAEEFIDAPSIDSPEATVTISVTDQTQSEVLTVGNYSAEKAIVIRTGESVGYVVKREDIKPLFNSALSFRGKTVLDLEESDVLSVQIDRTGKFPTSQSFARKAPEPQGPPVPGKEPEKKEEQAEESKAGDWILDGLERTAFEDLIDALTSLNADGWIDAPEEFDANVTVTIATGKESHKLLLDTSRKLGRVDGSDATFTIKTSTVDALNAEFKTQTVIDLDVDAINTVKAGDVTVKRDADGKYTLEGEGELDESNAGALFDTLAGLRADHFVASTADGDPTTTIELTAGDTKQSIKIWATANPVVAQVDDGPAFTLKSGDVAKLTAKVIK